jgi:hypothetical protein
MFLLILSYSCDAQNLKNKKTELNTSAIEVIQFHSEHRCKTCLLIEDLTKKSLQKFPAIPFKLVNVDDKKNEKMAEQFEATGTALFLYNSKTGKKKDMTDFAFMNANSNSDEFIKGLKKEIEAFMKK